MEPEQAEQPKQRTDHTADGLLTGRGIWPVANEFLPSVTPPDLILALRYSDPLQGRAVERGQAVTKWEES